MRTRRAVRAVISGTALALVGCVQAAAQTLAKPATAPTHGTTHLVVGEPGTRPQRRTWQVIILTGPGTVSP
ncbi:MAG TPA: hypothetical protein VGS06_11375 [Streptosporangiaceae bacterium]|nr:hypothetical protein [Streptosporangiaceae bacterium]